MADYRKQAQQEYDVGYNEKVQALKNQLAQNQQTLEQQKGGINANFDTQVANQNLSNKKSKNNLSNTMLGRGLSNSSIAVSGLAEADQINNRLVGQINTSRTGALNDIDQQKALLAQSMQGTLSGMSADRASAIEALARQLEDRAWEKDYKNQGLSLQREQMLADQQYKNASLAQQRELANAQIAWQREQAEMARQSQSSKSNNDAYNSFLDAYSTIKGRSDISGSEKEKAMFALAEQANMYGSQNGVDLSGIESKIYDWIRPKGYNKETGKMIY